MISTLRLTYGDTTYEYVQGSLMYQEAKVFQVVTHMTVGQWQNKLSEGDVEGYAALLWLVRQRAGERLSFDDLEFNVEELMGGILEVDEHGNEVIRNKLGEIEGVVQPDGTKLDAALPDPT